jgi:hypothetical protein
LPSATNDPHFFSMIIGRVVGVYINESVIRDGIVDVTRIKPIARLGYQDFSVVNQVFALARPTMPPVPNVAEQQVSTAGQK